MSLLIFSGVVLFASNQPAEEEEPYDEDTYGPEESIVWTKPLKSVTFSHKEHTLAADLSCEDCHDELFEMEAGAVEELDDFTMASLFEGNYCGACHDGSMAFASNSHCGSCHTAPEETIVWTKPVKAVVFDHDTHTEEMGLDCQSCHDELFIMKTGDTEEKDDYTMKALYKGKYCGACHDGATAFASNTRCTSCHIGVRGYARMTGGSEGDSGHGSGH